MATLYAKALKPLKNGKWRILEDSWENNKKKTRTVPRTAWSNLGINPTWTLEQARKRCSELNNQRREVRKEQTKIINIAERVDEMAFNPYAPADLVKDFLRTIKTRNFGSESHLKKMFSHWEYIAIMVATLEIEPHQYFDATERIYKYFISKHSSLDYSNKLLRILNMFGEFVSRYRGQFFKSVPVPRARARSAIIESYMNSVTYIGPSSSLKADELKAKKENLEIKFYNWLHLSVWFGLRPEEIDGLHQQHKWKVTTHENIKVLDVYQSKLMGLLPEERWKRIPVLYPEQEEGLAIIKSSVFERPTVKYIQKIFDNKKLRLYGGRKAFEDLMYEKGQAFEHVSSWLGHQNVQTTWNRYKRKTRVSYKK